MKLGFDAYSLRWQGWNAFQMLEYCLGSGWKTCNSPSEDSWPRSTKDTFTPCGAAQTSLGSPSRSDAQLRPLLRPLRPRSRGAPSRQLQEMIRAAKTLGSPIVRCVPATRRTGSGRFHTSSTWRRWLRVLRACLVSRCAIWRSGLPSRTMAESTSSLASSRRSSRRPEPITLGSARHRQPGGGRRGSGPRSGSARPYVVTSHVRDSRIWAVPTERWCSGFRWARGVSISAAFSRYSLTAHPPLRSMSRSSPVSRVIPGSSRI